MPAGQGTAFGQDRKARVVQSDHAAETGCDGHEDVLQRCCRQRVIAHHFRGIDAEIAHQRLDHASAPTILG